MEGEGERGRQGEMRREGEGGREERRDGREGWMEEDKVRSIEIVAIS